MGRRGQVTHVLFGRSGGPASQSHLSIKLLLKCCIPVGFISPLGWFSTSGACSLPQQWGQSRQRPGAQRWEHSTGGSRARAVPLAEHSEHST